MDGNYEMNMIRHNDIFINCGGRVKRICAENVFFNHATNQGKSYLRRGEGTLPYDIAKNFPFPCGAYRHKIPTLGIIKRLKP